MKIGIDASFLRKPGTGIGQVTASFLHHLSDPAISCGAAKSWQFFGGLQEAEFILYTEEPTEVSLPDRFRVRTFLPKYWKRDDVIRRALWERQLAIEARRDGCDMFVSLYQSGTRFRADSKVWHIMVVHDIIPRFFPEYLDKWTRRWHWRLVERGIASASHLVAVSEYTKQDIMRELHIGESKITVAYPGISAVFDSVCSDEYRDQVLRKYQVDPGYIYHGGGFEARKNARMVLDAYAMLKATRSRRGIDTPKLLLSGKIHSKKNPLATDIEGLIRKYDLARDVVLTGFVPEEALPALYRGALMFVYPSLYEGFGLPPIESMSQGVPVIASRSSSLPEVCGDAALFVDPLHSGEMTEAMGRLLDDAVLRDELARKGMEHVKQFSWNIFVRRVLA